MLIKCLKVGFLETNCYLLEKNNEILIIDPGDDFDLIKNTIGDKKVVGCLLTHNHFDHIGALNEVQKFYNIKVNNYNNKNFNYEILETPGHTKDSLTFYFQEDKVMFCGDFLFYHNIGRTDLGGNIDDMKNSLNFISKFSNDIKIYPGHGQSTTLGEEKKRFSNYF